MESLNVTYIGSFAAGVLSFLSPCVLPLVPPYLCFLAGATLDDLTGGDMGKDGEVTASLAAANHARKQVRLSALAFVIGFSVIFISLGATASVVGQFVLDHLDMLAKIAGGIIVILGLHFLGVLKIAPLFRDIRFNPQTRPTGMLGAFVIGMAFAFGWTPCVGPILATILIIAGSEGSIAHGTGLLAVYSAGLAIPFLIAAMAVKPFMAFLRHIRAKMRLIEITIGGLLMITGLLILTGGINDISFWLLETFPILGETG